MPRSALTRQSPSSLKTSTKLKFPQLNFEELKNVTLDQSPLKSLQTGIEFEQPVNIGVDDTEMKIGAGVSGSLRPFSTKDEQLFDPEVFADPINIGPNQFYVGVGTSVTVSSGLTHSVCFGGRPHEHMSHCEGARNEVLCPDPQKK